MYSTMRSLRSSEAVSLLIALPWLIEALLVVAFCGWCIYIYRTKEQGAATDIALFVFVTAVLCIVHQALHVALIAAIHCDRCKNKKKDKVDDYDVHDEEAKVEQQGFLVDDVDLEIDEEIEGGKRTEDRAGIKDWHLHVVSAFHFLSCLIGSFFVGWMIYGCLLVFKHPIQHYHG